MFQHNLRWPLLLAAVVAAQALASPAYSSCVSAFNCLCPYTQGIVVQAKVLDIQAVPAVVLIEAIDNPTAEPTSLAEGATASAELAVFNIAAAKYAVGDRFLGIGLNAGGVRSVVHIDKDEHVTCIYAPTFRPTVAQARAIMSSSNCEQAMTAAGFKQPPCNDTPRMGEPGCMAGRGAGGLGGAVALVGSLALLLSRRRARVHRRG